MKARKRHLISMLAGVGLLIAGLVFFVSVTDDPNDLLRFDGPGEYARYFHDITNPPSKSTGGYPVNHRYAELVKARTSLKNQKSTPTIYPWVQRGPGNVGGRTRSIVIDPADPTYNTWFAGAVSGGIWKTTDGGDSWTDLSADFPNLAISAMAMAPSNHDIIYAGTGEGHGGFGMVAGNGIFKTTDRGDNWFQLSSTVMTEDFRYVNTLVVDPSDFNVVLAGTNRGIFKSADGGNSWNPVYQEGYRVQKISANPQNFNILYAGAYGLGILKSTDRGETWQRSLNGLGEGGRFHVAISGLNPAKIFTSVEAIGFHSGIPRLETHVYMSVDHGENWAKYVSPENFLGNQGWFNNVIAVHPFNDNSLFIGGVSFGRIDFKPGISQSEPQVMRVDTVGTAPFMQFVNFGGRFLGGGMAVGSDEDATDLVPADWSSVEIRFGPGLTQNAHRFTVPTGQGAGVPPNDYTYRDYVEVPFQAWDTDNNRQLMVSFRDQANDGKFNLEERRFNDEISGREYLFVHAVPYSNSSPSDKIAINAGHNYKQLYFFWPSLPNDSVWDETKLPLASIHINYGTYSMLSNESVTTILADYRKNTNLHVDHHEILTLVTDAVEQEFIILEANDGGMGISFNEGQTWKQINRGYITTQFYGAAKRPGAHEYIGGMQDNGTWQSPSGQISDVTAEYNERIGGDGFEVLWHPKYPQRIIGSSYNNFFYVTTDGGITWKRSSGGINGDGPFISRLENSDKNPDRVFAVGSKGLFRHNNFGMGRFNWQTIIMPNGWSINQNVSSQHNVKISLADDNIIWAGAGMYKDPDLSIFVSTDGGTKFNAVPNYTQAELGYISGMATHPTEKNTAFLLFSLPEKPKILRTTDLGSTWEDISGFGSGKTSLTGFPDVIVNCLLVLPSQPSILWAGTEIGIFQSTDNGNSWHFANNGLPAVSVWQMFAQDGFIVVATHGRGVWTLEKNYLSTPDRVSADASYQIFPNPVQDLAQLTFKSSFKGNIRFLLYSTDGRVVLDYAGYKSEFHFQHPFDMGTLPKGNYIGVLHYGIQHVSLKLTKR